MILPFSPVALAAIVLSTPFAFALSPSDIPVDTPVSKLLTTANQKLASGQAQEALTYFDVAISRDPSNYLTVFKRGAAYLSLGKTQQAHQDFNKALALKPDFEGALLQRAKIHSRNGKWADAKKDFLAAGKKGGTEISELEEAQGAATLAEDAASKGDWDACVAQAGVAIIVAGTALDLRKLRARCRFEKGEVAEGVSDLQHVLQINSGSTEPHMQISAMTYYSLGEREAGLSQIRKCLQSDPDSKPCRKLMRKEKALAKDLKKVEQLMEKRQFNSATKLILPKGDDAGLLQEVKGDIKQYKEEGLIYKNSPEGLYNKLVEMTCECYMEMNTRKKAQPYCREALVSNPGHLQGLLCKAQDQLDADDFEPAINTLNEAKKYHEGSQKIQEMLNNAQTLLKRSKQKDYYKVLGVDRDADERDIKRAYRKLSMKFHPDKAGTEGISKEAAETKMASINEAYEVLSDPELKARFDRGDDPNNPEQAGPFGGSPFGQGAGGHQFFFRTGPGQGFPGGFPGGQFKFSQEGGGAGGFQFPGGFDFP